jgi:hypothetical protein
MVLIFLFAVFNQRALIPSAMGLALACHDNVMWSITCGIMVCGGSNKLKISGDGLALFPS